MSRFFGRVSVNRSAGRSSLNPKTDWLVPLIGTAKAVESAGDLMPFPYIGEAAGIVVKLLEGIQRVKKNKDDFRDLAESIVDIIRAVRDEIVNTMKKTHEESSPDSSRLPDFREPCTRFIDYLVGLLKEVDEASRKNDNWIKQYLKSNEMRDAIARNQKRVEHHRANFTLSTVVNMRMYLQETMVLPKSGTSSVWDNELEKLSQDYHSLILGDLDLEEERERPDPGLRDIVIKVTSDYVATVRGTTKTVRVYQGEHAADHFLSNLRVLSSLRHPNIMQVFGICKSSASLALVFHGDYRTIDEHLATLDPFESIQFQYRMKQDYPAAWSYMKQWLPHCHNNLNLGADFFLELCSYACRCHHVFLHNPIDHFLRVLVRTDSGKMCISISRIHSPRREHVYEKNYHNLRSLVPKEVLLPLGSTQWSLTSLKSKILGFFNMVAALSRTTGTARLLNPNRDLPLAIGDIYDNHKVPHKPIPRTRLLVVPPLPYKAITSTWKPHKTQGLPVSHPWEGWTRVSITRLEKHARIVTDEIGVEPSVFMMTMLIQAPKMCPESIHRPKLVLSAVDRVHARADFWTYSPPGGPDVLYYFIQDLRINEQGVVPFPKFFCSLDPFGRERIPLQEYERMMINPQIFLMGDGQQYPAAAYYGIEDLCNKSGIQLGTESIFRLLDLPPYRLNFFPETAFSDPDQYSPFIILPSPN